MARANTRTALTGTANKSGESDMVCGQSCSEIRDPRNRRASAHAPAAPKRPHVTVRGLTKQFGPARIYDDFDLDLPRGQLISVFGPNGCGKSTLISIIAGLIPADAG